MSATAPASGLQRVTLIVSALAPLARFYAKALDAVEIASSAVDPGWGRLLGLEGRAAGQLLLRIGDQEVVLVAVDPPGAVYPPQSTATDLWFQHMAIVVADMDRACAQVMAAGAVPISRHGPAQLPASTGGVRAFKFRDPDGHPLELLAFPVASGPASWRHPPPGRLFLGIDHSAIAVSDAAQLTTFYAETLGLRRTAASVNRGAAQVDLDDVEGDAVDVVALSPLRPTPHLELLGYRTGSRRALPGGSGPADVAATRLVFTIADAAPLAVQAPLVALDDGRAGVALTDPDGHRIVVVGGGPLVQPCNETA